jgi:hypothetical protein
MAEKTTAIAPYVIVRTYSAGVFAGILARREGKEVELHDARRIWYWAGAASLSQLAVDGTSKPKDCKFPAAVASVVLTEAIEILSTTPEAEASIRGVALWRA